MCKVPIRTYHTSRRERERDATRDATMLYAWGVIILLAHLLRSGDAFDVPFPSSAAEIRAAVVVSSTSAPSMVTTRQVVLGSGTRAEVISSFPQYKSSPQDLFRMFFGTSTNYRVKQAYEKPVLVFLHGSFHASWCWQEKWMPHFASLGYPCVALSLQGTGGTPTVEVGAKTVRIGSHVRDFDAFLRGLSDNDSNSLGMKLGVLPRIVLFGHSFGGLTIMKWLEQYYADENENTNIEKFGVNLAGVSLLCSVPPSGNGKMTMRFLRRSFRDSWTIIAGFVLKRAITDKAICRDLFFGGSEDANGVTDEDVERYQSYFERDTAAIIDLNDLSRQLPSAKMDKQSGKAHFADKLPASLVIAASNDFIVDEEVH
jgi:pimeloyl-ACP methyl ester carboxylesterase